MVWLPDGVKSLICLSVSIEYQRVTDGHLATAMALCIASCGKKGGRIVGVGGGDVRGNVQIANEQ